MDIMLTKIISDEKIQKVKKYPRRSQRNERRQVSPCFLLGMKRNRLRRQKDGFPSRGGFPRPFWRDRFALSGK